MPSLIIISAIGPPARIDWPTMVCCQTAMPPCASSPALTAWTYIGRYSPALVSSSRLNCTRTGTPTDRLGDVDGGDREVAPHVGAPAKAAARHERVQLDLVHRQPRG